VAAVKGCDFLARFGGGGGVGNSLSLSDSDSGVGECFVGEKRLSVSVSMMLGKRGARFRRVIEVQNEKFDQVRLS